MTLQYELPASYRIREKPEFNDHIAIAQKGIVYQQEVYDLAARIAREREATTLFDIGCGHAEKAVQTGLFPIGVDIESSIQWCRQNYSSGRWIAADLETEFPDVGVSDQTVVICADVIEHLVKPDQLLEALCSFSENPSIESVVVSTPDRARINRAILGPPPNPTHVREWTAAEFVRLLKNWKFGGRFGLQQSWVKPHKDARDATTIVCYWKR